MERRAEHHSSNQVSKVIYLAEDYNDSLKTNNRPKLPKMNSQFKNDDVNNNFSDNLGLSGGLKNRLFANLADDLDLDIELGD